MIWPKGSDLDYNVSRGEMVGEVVDSKKFLSLNYFKAFLAPKLWNFLPTYVRNAKDISTFKLPLKKQVLRFMNGNFKF